MQVRKINIKVIVIIVYFILTFAMLIRQSYTSAEVVKRAEREIQRQKEYSAQMKTEEAVAAPAVKNIEVRESSVESVPSTDLFLKAVQAEKGAQQQQEQPQVLDYGAQVAAYEAQAKAQQQKAVQNTGNQQAYTAPLPSQRQTGVAANTNTASSAQPEKQQETKLNKLETRRIFK